MIRSLKIKNSSGDTIVEVLIVLAVLSLAFAISYTTANRALNGSRNAQEHSETQNALNSQIEKLRSAYSAGVAVPEDQPFCMKDDGTVAGFGTGTSIPASASADTLASPSFYPLECVSSNGFYHYSIVYTGATPTQKGYFDVRVRWDGPGSAGRQQVQTSYKTYKPTGDSSSGTPLSSSPTSINVFVKKIPPRGVGHANNSRTNNTPACSDLDRVNIGGITVSVTGSNAYSANGQTTAAGSNINFSGLTEFGNYTATATLPNGYTACTSLSRTVNGATGANTTPTIDIKPNCPAVTVSDPRVAVYRTESTPQYLHIPGQWYQGARIVRTGTGTWDGSEFVSPRLNFSNPAQPIIRNIYGDFWYAERLAIPLANGSFYDIYYASYVGPFDWWIGTIDTEVFDHWTYPTHTEWRCTP